MPGQPQSFSLGARPRPFEELADAVVRHWPDTVVGRLRDAIELHVPNPVLGSEPVVVLLTPEALEVRLACVDWTAGTHGPVPSSRRWRRVRLTAGDAPPDVIALVHESAFVREQQYQICQFCREWFAPEHMILQACHSCASRERGVVF